MNKIKNPFSPGAGSPPPELAGRDDVLEQAEVLLGRVLAKKPEKSLLLTGLRGVGKTVLLNEIERLAKTMGYRTLLVEAHDGKSLAALLAPALRSLLFELDRVAGAGDKVRRGMAVLKSFVLLLAPGEYRVAVLAKLLPKPLTVFMRDQANALPGWLHRPTCRTASPATAHSTLPCGTTSQ